MCGIIGLFTATVKMLVKDGTVYIFVVVGIGLVDVVFKVIDVFVGLDVVLMEYRVIVVIKGINLLVEMIITVKSREGAE